MSLKDKPADEFAPTAKAIYNAALEEAAKVCEHSEYAEQIRKLKK